MKKFLFIVCITFIKLNTMDIDKLSGIITLAHFSCQFCPDTFKSRSGLNRHLKKNHEQSIPQCNFCKKHFVLQETFNRHICKKLIKMFKCTQCENIYISEKKLQNHFVLEHIKSEYLCCDTYFNLRQIKKHISTCHVLKISTPIETDEQELGSKDITDRTELYCDEAYSDLDTEGLPSCLEDDQYPLVIQEQVYCYDPLLVRAIEQNTCWDYALWLQYSEENNREDSSLPH